VNQSRIMEALGILQEECAEVIQSVSKWRRAGPDFCPRGGREPPYRDQLQSEVNDVKVIIEILEGLGVLDPTTLESHRPQKLERLKAWSCL